MSHEFWDGVLIGWGVMVPTLLGLEVWKLRGELRWRVQKANKRAWQWKERAEVFEQHAEQMHAQMESEALREHAEWAGQARPRFPGRRES